MDNYISRQMAMNAFAEYVRWSNYSDFAPTPTWNDAVEIVKNLPSADVQQVVRCKDCIYWHEAPAADGFNSCEMDALIRHEMFFFVRMENGMVVNRMVQIDMNMPKRCFDCLIEYADDWTRNYECPLVYKGYTDTIRMEGRLAECPLREVN